MTDSLEVSGSGAALAAAPVEQDSAYWEIVVVKPGPMQLGVSRKMPAKLLDAGLDGKVGDPPKSWTFDGGKLAEGDVVGVAFTQCDLPNLSFTKNGEPTRESDVKKIGGMVYPVVSVGGEAVIRVVFAPESFANAPPPGAKPLMVVRSIL